MKLSVAMIVKNEEKEIYDCLNSVWEADEIVVVDTGSEDSTCKVIKEADLTGKVNLIENGFVWCDDFSAARNFANSKCSGDWILVIDADERLEEGGILKIREACEKAKRAVSCLVKSKKGNQHHRNVRVYRNCPEIFWQKPIHNHLNVQADYDCMAVVEFGYSESHKNDPDRAFRILSKYVSENPDSTRERYYLAREHFYRKEWQKSINILDGYLPRSRFKAERADAWLMRARCLWNLQRGEEARESCFKAILNNAQFKEAFLFMSEMISSDNQARWQEMAEGASNENVLFIR